MPFPSCHDVKTLTPDHMNVALFGNRDFSDGQTKMRSLEWAQIQYGHVLIRRGNLDIERDTHTGRMPCGSEDKTLG